MPSPAHPRLRSPGERAEWPFTAPYAKCPAPDGDRPASAVLRVACSGEGFARARVFTRDTLSGWSLDHRGDDAVLVITELVSNAVAHALPSAAAGPPEVRLGLALDPGHLTLTVSDPGDGAPVFQPFDDSALREHGRGLCIVDALAEEWGWTPRPPAGKTVWAKLSTRPLT
ncbi:MULTISPECIES: ATP-binding protein [unclassified Streptomyces]|uniref:ATP-binding protein n=1 Tax=unclassified Streptomyces TaxID=2593676 RepID=UPI0035E2E1DC